MHDANHGSYSSLPWLNKALSFTMELIGGSGANWRIKHNILHHTYTNIDGHDEDLNAGIVIRFSPQARKWRIHRYQHVYSWFFYGLLTLLWIATSDFIGLARYSKRGLTKASRLSTPLQFVLLALFKLFYLAYIIALPLLLTDMQWWHVLIGFTGMHFIAGFILSAIFLCAHIVEQANHPVPEVDGTIKNEWAVHQLFTTANFGRGKKFLTWFVGGLNYQVEHHLFPKICHVHYPQLAVIVQQTAGEFNLPYYSYPSFRSALRSHHRMLKRLGHE
jgi:linoleoyl-CoA desaturase